MLMHSKVQKQRKSKTIVTGRETGNYEKVREKAKAEITKARAPMSKCGAQDPYQHLIKGRNKTYFSVVVHTPLAIFPS